MGFVSGFDSCAGSSRTEINYGCWVETLVVVLLGTGVVLFIAFPAAGTPFFAENFQFMGQYREAGNLLEAVLCATPDGWFRPVDKLFSILSHELLPGDPLAFGLRNLFFTSLLLLVLHRFSLRLSRNRFSRVLAVLYFAVSGMHMSMLGYYNLMGTLLEALFLLSGFLLLWSALEKGGRKGALAAGYGLIGLGIFSKETGVVALPAAAAMLLVVPVTVGKLPQRIRRAGLRTLPVAVMVGLLFFARFLTAGSVLPVSTMYTPQFGLNVLGRNTLAFSASFGNLSFTDKGATGAGGLGYLLETRFPGEGWLRFVDPGMCVFILVIFGVLLCLKGRGDRRVIFPLMWAAASFVIHLTTRNLQLYYTYDCVLAASMILMITLQDAGRFSRGLAVIMVLLSGINGLISTRTSLYHWQYVAQHAGEVTGVVAEHWEEAPAEQLVFITKDESFWKFAVGGAIIPELLADPGLEIDFYSPEEVKIKEYCTGSMECFNLDEGRWLVFPPVREGG